MIITLRDIRDILFAFGSFALVIATVAGLL